MVEDRIREAVVAGSWIDPQQIGPGGAPVESSPPPLISDSVARVLGEFPGDGASCEALRLRNAHILGAFDLRGYHLCPIELENCLVEGALSLDGAIARTLRVVECQLTEPLSAEQLETTGDLSLQRLRAPQVRLTRARIGGQLDLRGANLSIDAGAVLDASEITVTHSVTCAEDWKSQLPFTAHGEVRLSGARIGGRVDLRGARLTATDGLALDASDLSAARGVLGGVGERSRQPFTVNGMLRLSGAHIRGRLELIGAQLRNPSGIAFGGYDLRVDGDVLCHQDLETGIRFKACGQFKLPGARLGGRLDFSGAELHNAGNSGFDGYAMDVKGNMLCGPKDHPCAAPLIVRGEFDLGAARIHGHASLKHARLLNGVGVALRGTDLQVDQSLACTGLRTSGEVLLHAAHVGGRLDLNGAALLNPVGRALSASALSVDGDLDCAQSAAIPAAFTAEGDVSFVRARVGGQLNLKGARLTRGVPNGSHERRWALDAFSLNVGHSLLASQGFSARGGVNLNGGAIGGRLDMTGAELINPYARALDAYGLHVAGGMICKRGDGESDPPFKSHGEMHLVDAQIGGQLNLRGAELIRLIEPKSANAQLPSERVWALNAYGLRVDGSLIADRYFSAAGGVLLNGARIGGEFTLANAKLAAVSADWALSGFNLEVDQDMAMRNLHAHGGVQLGGVRIGGRLDLGGAQLRGSGRRALDAAGITVEGGAVLGWGTDSAGHRTRFTAHGNVSLVHGSVSGQLDLTGAHLIAPSARGDRFPSGKGYEAALTADWLTVGTLFGRRGFAADGEVRLLRARILGDLDLTGAELTNESDTAAALLADGLSVGGKMSLQSGFHAQGLVSMVGAHVYGQLELSGAKLVNQRDTALLADAAQIDQGMFCSGDLTAQGEVSLVNARVGGMLVLSGATLSNPHEQTSDLELVPLALNAERMNVDGELLAGPTPSLVPGGPPNHPLMARGRVCLTGAHVTGRLVMDGATLTRGNGQALDAERLEVDEDVSCGRGFRAEGSVTLAGARIGGQLRLDGARLPPIGEGDPDEQRASAETSQLDGVVNLTGARIGELRDGWLGESDAQSPFRYRTRIAGFVYESLGDGADGLAQRLDWIEHAEDGYVPQAYDQLIEVLRRAGREEDARDAAIAKLRRRRKQLRLWRQPWDLFVDVSVGYGYRTARSAYALLGVVIAGWFVFAWAWSSGYFRPLKRELPDFAPWLYSIDAVLPVINLGQESSWAPTGPALYWYAFSVLSGWILGTALVAALTASLTRK